MMLKIVIVCCWVLACWSSAVSEAASDLTASESRRSVVHNLKTSLPYLPESRVVGGQPAPIEKYPYAVQVTTYNVVTCGGTLVSTKHVLTAAHCGFQHGSLVEMDVVYLRMGSVIPLKGGTTYDCAQFVKHPMYNAPLRDSDIGLFVTKSEVTLGPAVSIALVAPREYDVADNAKVTYIGWGYLGNGLPQAESLQEVPVFVVPWEQCRRRYGELERVTNRSFPVTRNMFCAGLLDVGGKDACGGDSGGPVIEGGVVVGVISWGLLCADRAFPGVNIKVSRYYDWIDDTLDKLPGIMLASVGTKLHGAVLTLCTVVFCFYFLSVNTH